MKWLIFNDAVSDAIFVMGRTDEGNLLFASNAHSDRLSVLSEHGFSFDSGLGFWRADAGHSLKVKRFAADLQLSYTLSDLTIDEIKNNFDRFAAGLNAKTASDEYALPDTAVFLIVDPDGNRIYRDKDYPNIRYVRDEKTGHSIQYSVNDSQKRCTTLYLGRFNDKQALIDSVSVMSDLGLIALDYVRKGIKPNLKQLAATLFDNDRIDESLWQPVFLQDVFECAQLVFVGGTVNDGGRFISSNFNRFGKQEYFDLLAVEDAVPKHSFRDTEKLSLQQYSTPIGLSVIAQKLLFSDYGDLSESQMIDATANKRLLEPSVGNGGLLSVLHGFKLKIDGFDLSDSRYLLMRRLFGDYRWLLGRHQDTDFNMTQADFTEVNSPPNSYDFVIANPPFGKYENVQGFDKIPKVPRIDHLIALKSLAARKDDGRAVIIFGADSVLGDGRVGAATSNFLAYLYDHYEVDGLVEIDGSLYANSGTTYNVRMAVIGERRPVPIQDLSAPVKGATLRIISSHSDLFDWSQEVVNAVLSKRNDLSVTIPDLNPKPVVESVSNLGPIAQSEPTESAVVLPDNFSGDTLDDADQFEAPEPSTDDRSVNTYQVPYQSFSKAAGGSKVMIPINMAAAVALALNRVVNETGMSVDEFVADRLQYSLDEILAAKHFSAEQIDAIALGIFAVERGRAFVNADQTGLGKGRAAAAMMRYAKLSNRLPVFCTISSGLFTDIYRDLNDIDSAHLFDSPLIFNADGSIKDFSDGKTILHRVTPRPELQKLMDDAQYPDGIDVVFTTYSQFQLDISKNKKARYFSQLCANTLEGNNKKEVMLILDESHIAAGLDSNIGAVLCDGVNTAKGGVVYSSATPFKGVNNFKVYSKIFPKSVDIETLPEVLSAGGEGIMESLSDALARDGSIIRREKDLSRLKFTSLLPTPEIEDRNREISDSLAEILNMMCELSGDVSREVSALNESYREQEIDSMSGDNKGSRMQASSMSFGSRLASINQQFLLAIKTDQTIDHVISQAKKGLKPIIALENTGESLTNLLIFEKSIDPVITMRLMDIEGELSSSDLSDDVKKRLMEEQELLNKQLEEKQKNVVLDELPQFRDLLRVMVERIRNIKVQGRYGDVSYTTPSSEEYLSKENAVMEMIQDFPDLPLTALDLISARLEEAGLKTAEISGRKTFLKPFKDGDKTKWRVEVAAKKLDPTAQVAGFQNGTYDVAMITRAGSTGISLHATARFADSDSRQRDFVTLQKARNIAEFMQLLGRADRKDQVIEPIITTVESALPAELRLTMMHNEKLRKLSANVTSNRDNQNVNKSVSDFLNVIGERVATNYLYENPRLAHNLDISLPDEDGAKPSRFSTDCPVVNRLMGRLMLLPVKDQEKIISDIQELFDDAMADLTARGENPFETKVFDVRGTVRELGVWDSSFADVSDSVFDEPVLKGSLEYIEVVNPIRANELLDRAREGHAKMIERYPQWFDGDALSRPNALRQILNDRIEGEAQKLLPKAGEKIIEDAAKNGETLTAVDVGCRILNKKPISLRIVSLVERKKFIEDLIVRNGLNVGAFICCRNDTTGLNEKAMVVGVDFPKSASDVFMLGKYHLHIVRAGSDKVQTISLQTFYNNCVSDSLDSEITVKSALIASIDKPSCLPERFDANDQSSFSGVHFLLRKQYIDFLKSCDDAPSGEIKRERAILTGNLFRATERATQDRFGKPCVFTDANGLRVRSVMVNPLLAAHEIYDRPIEVKAAEVNRLIDAFLEARAVFAESIDDHAVVAPTHLRCAEFLIPDGSGTKNAIKITLRGDFVRPDETLRDGRIDGMRIVITVPKKNENCDAFVKDGRLWESAKRKKNCEFDKFFNLSFAKGSASESLIASSGIVEFGGTGRVKELIERITECKYARAFVASEFDKGIFDEVRAQVREERVEAIEREKAERLRLLMEGRAVGAAYLLNGEPSI